MANNDEFPSIWENRLKRELSTLREDLQQGISIAQETVEYTEGICTLVLNWDGGNGESAHLSDNEDDPALVDPRKKKEASAEKLDEPMNQENGQSFIKVDIIPIDPDEEFADMEKEIRSIEMPGLVWGKSDFIEIALGVKKIQIRAVTEDSLVSMDALREKIEELDDLVMSVEIFAEEKTSSHEPEPEPVAAAACAAEPQNDALDPLKPEAVISVDMGIPTRYPFEPPKFQILEGMECFPGLTDMLTGGKLHESWTPSSNLAAVLASAIKVARNPVQPSEPEDSSKTPAAEAVFMTGDIVDMDALREDEALLGPIFPCKQLNAGSLTQRMSTFSMSAYTSTRHLLLTTTQVVEIEESRLSSRASVLSCANLRHLARLQFKAGRSELKIMFKPSSKLAPLNLDMQTAEAASQCVDLIRHRLKTRGVTGIHTSVFAAHCMEKGAELVRQAQSAHDLLIVQAASTRGHAVGRPQVADVNHVMDLYRQAAEVYGALPQGTGTEKHQNVLDELHKFLQDPTTLEILEGDQTAPEESVMEGLQAEEVELQADEVDKDVDEVVIEDGGKEAYPDLDSLHADDKVEEVV
uniref:Translation elongation factor EF1B beta/delta subunit guanine nucleotide exchange domain-containing protein n=1 Tax=Octactis speculum TaxID=3111310 RepID=A0A7S2AVY5_9STRA|mmetsp:Transcript_16538/g.22186  ORF Transcript_16538/g.22186 Transcript_16538/m.22186 type:complete len:581 (+) Transcript_16538:82-1824(+)